MSDMVVNQKQISYESSKLALLPIDMCSSELAAEETLSNSIDLASDSSNSPRKSKKQAKHSLSVRLKTIVTNLGSLWPPDSEEDVSNDLNKDASKFLKKSWLKPTSRMLKGDNYCPVKHNDVDFMQLLNDTFAKNHFLSPIKLKKLMLKTGLSKMIISAWFKWKRSEQGLYTPKQVLLTMFNKSQYLHRDELDNLMNETGFTREQILSWFRVSRALANVYEPGKADLEETILQRMFDLHKSGLTDKEVNLMSYLLRMEKHHVYTIFLTWCQRYDVPNLMNCPDETDAQTQDRSSENALGQLTSASITPSRCYTGDLRLRSLSDSNIRASALSEKNSCSTLKPSKCLVRSISSPALIGSSYKEKCSIIASPEENVETQAKDDAGGMSSSDDNLVIDTDECDDKEGKEKATVNSDLVGGSSDRNMPGVSDHDKIIRKLRKLRKKQFRDGIPCKIKRIIEPDRIVIVKKRKAKRKKLKNVKRHSFKSFAVKNIVSDESDIASTRERKLSHPTHHLSEILRANVQDEGCLKLEDAKSVSCESTASTSVEEELFDLLQDESS